MVSNARRQPGVFVVRKLFRPLYGIRPLTVRLLLVFSLVLVTYVTAVGNFFLFDDGPAIVSNSAINQMDTTHAVAWRDAILSSNAGPTGRPLSMLSLALDASWQTDLSATPFKLTSLFIHLSCGLLLLLWLRALGRSPGLRLRWPPALAALAVALWLVAPLHVSTVLYPVQRMAQLATLFALLGLWLYCRWRNRWAEAGASAGEVIAAALWLALVVLLALLSKENGILLLWLLALVEIVVYRGRWQGTERPWLQRLAWLAVLAPLLVLAWVLIWRPELLLAGYAARDFTVTERLLTQLRVLWLYVGWLILPLPGQLGFLHDYIPVSRGWFTPASTLLAGLGWLTVLGLATWQYKARPWLTFGVLFFLVGHSLESGLLALEMVFEHRNYLPSIGLFIVLAGLLCELAARLPTVSPRLGLAALFLPMLLLLGLRTWTWGDELRMTEAHVRHHPDSPRGHYFHARALERVHERKVEAGTDPDLGDLLMARAALQRMAALDPGALAPWAALFLLDERWFPANPEQAQWLDAMIANAERPRLSASDANGVNAVLARLQSDCERHAQRAAELLDALAGSHSSLDLELARYRLARDCGHDEQGPDRILASLQSLYPDNIRVLYLRLEAAVVAEDVGAMYAVVARIMEQDPGRRELSHLRRLVAD